MKIKAEFVNDDPILDVEIQPVGFLNQQLPNVVPLQELQHCAELRTAGALGCLDVYKFTRNDETLLLGVFMQKTKLCGNTESLLLLL